MKTEQEVLSMLRSALDEHEKTPFDQIRDAVTTAQSDKKAPERGGFWLRHSRSFALAAACLVIVAGIGFVFQSSLREQIFFEYAVAPPEAVEAGEGSPAAAADAYDPPMDGAENFGMAADESPVGGGFPENAPEMDPAEAPQASLGSLVSDRLLALLEEYADQPNHRFAVSVSPCTEDSAEDTAKIPKEESLNGSKRAALDLRELTADEIWALTDQGFFLDVAPEDPFSSR